MHPSLDDAVRDNASWCDAYCRSHGLAGTFGPRAWTSRSRTPALYPDAITLTPQASRDDVLGPIDTSSPGCSVKDSYATLDLATAGFGVVLEAQWIGSAPPVPATRGRWTAVTDRHLLDAWEAAWATEPARGRFLPALLERPDVMVLAEVRDGTVVAGAIVTRGEAVVGLSNFFERGGDADASWAACIGAIGYQAPGLPVVGYESGALLDVATRHGFRRLGPLRVWRAQPVRPSKR